MLARWRSQGNFDRIVYVGALFELHRDISGNAAVLAEGLDGKVGAAALRAAYGATDEPQRGEG
jgi:hypothetical protein